jgi:3-hydroxymyristoyl/3-hydroxydecanoyl-(acyl carrier protein) dehydratase
MLPWYAGVPVHARKPLLAADIEFALRQCARPCWWMTTAVQLRAPLNNGTPLEGLEGILASTMSVPAALAAAAESAWKVPVMEVYGSTETGALAIRRTACESAWVPLAGVSLWHEGEGEGRKLWAAGTHVGPPVQLGDDIQFQPDGRFLWLGRSNDLIKVGGRRASLSALNRSLTDIPGVADGAYCVPDQASAAGSDDGPRPAPRLAAFYVSPTLSPEDVLRALRTRVDPAFLPRPLHRVAELPRNANGKLPQAALAGLLAQCKLEMNRAARSRPGGAIQRMAVPSKHPALPGHFPNRPIVPGVVILARVMETIRAQLPHIELGALMSARFHSPLAPGRDFLVRAQLQGEQVRFEIRMPDCSQFGPGALIAGGQWACRPKRLAGDAGV